MPVKKTAVQKEKPVVIKVPQKPAVKLSPPAVIDTTPASLEAEETVPAAATPDAITEAPVAPVEGTPIPKTPAELSVPVVSPEAPETKTDVPPTIPESEAPLSSDWGSFRKEELARKKGKLVPTLLIIIVLLALGIGGYFFWNSSYNPITKAMIPTPTLTPSVTAVPTVAKVDLSAYSIQVLNGSEVAGEAVNAQGNLTSAGFNVPFVGNAPSSILGDTQIAVKQNVSKEFIKKLKETLAAKYGVSSELLQLDKNDKADVVVTLGSNINK